MTLLGVTKIPTIIVNAYDLMWYDVDVGSDDPNPFFFKNNPIDYLGNLQEEGWTVYTYAGSSTDEVKRFKFPQKNPEEYLTRKLTVMITLFENVLNFVQEAELPKLIKAADASSFVIIDSTRPFYEGITRYSSIEIFELVDPPTIPTDAIVVLITDSSVSRWESVNQYLRNILGKETFLLDIPRDHNEFIRAMNRYNPEKEIFLIDAQRDLNEFFRAMKGYNPEKEIFIVWSPVYRYAREDRISGGYIFERPDQLNIPGVTVYTWGY
ncbi:Hypothetical protein HVR_LOCUS352 [uncultured virus]|nr:Hypothetical protein HVR_LOCUS352 [uncultured virus]